MLCVSVYFHAGLVAVWTFEEFIDVFVGAAVSAGRVGVVGLAVGAVHYGLFFVGVDCFGSFYWRGFSFGVHGWLLVDLEVSVFWS